MYNTMVIVAAHISCAVTRRGSSNTTKILSFMLEFHLPRELGRLAICFASYLAKPREAIDSRKNCIYGDTTIVSIATYHVPRILRQCFV